MIIYVTQRLEGRILDVSLPAPVEAAFPLERCDTIDQRCASKDRDGSGNELVVSKVFQNPRCPSSYALPFLVICSEYVSVSGSAALSGTWQALESAEIPIVALSAEQSCARQN